MAGFFDYRKSDVMQGLNRASRESKLVYEKGGLHAYYGEDDRSSTPPAKAPSAKTSRPPAKKGGKSQEKAEQSLHKAEFVLEGVARPIADPNLKSNATIEISGVGNVLNGVYYVESVMHTWSINGYEQELEVKSNTYGGLKLESSVTPTAVPIRGNKITSTPIQVESQYYVVKPGDTLWKIATNFGTTHEKIAKINKITKPNSLQPGDRLIMP